ncbi:endonuclease [Treponema sp.]|uniref:endonuclease n=1 Tax=Treponema sp. TaxID=166 RepID=UPI00388E1A16
MTKTQRLRMTIDITMTILSIILMGGNYLFPADLVHEILGVALFVLWAIHITLNRRWYGAMFKGKYNPYRVMQTFINCGILICTIFLMISGIILSHHIFTFLNIQGGLGFARIAHLLASHWYYLFMSLHIGLHVGMIFGNKGTSTSAGPSTGSWSAIIPRIILALISAYGIYAFIARGVWKYLILRQQFFFFDLERGYVLFALDYISIIILFATISHLIASRLKKNR